MILSNNYTINELTLKQGVTVSKDIDVEVQKDKEVRQLISKGILINKVVEEFANKVAEEVVEETIIVEEVVKPVKKKSKPKKKVSKK